MFCVAGFWPCSFFAVAVCYLWVVLVVVVLLPLLWEKCLPVATVDFFPGPRTNRHVYFVFVRSNLVFVFRSLYACTPARPVHDFLCLIRECFVPPFVHLLCLIRVLFVCLIHVSLCASFGYCVCLIRECF